MENLEYYMDRLRRIRIHKEIKQSDIAKHLGVSQAYYSRWEGSYTEMPFRIYVEIADYLNIPLDYLCGNKKGSIDIDP